jgi:hypothetical protein
MLIGLNEQRMTFSIWNEDLVSHPFWNDDQLSCFHPDVALMVHHEQSTFDYIQELILIIMLLPVKFALELFQFDGGSINFPYYLGTARTLKLRKMLTDIYLFHHDDPLLFSISK